MADPPRIAPDMLLLMQPDQDWRRRRYERWQLDQGENAKLSCRFDGITTFHNFLKVELLVKVREALEMKRAFCNGELQKKFVQKVGRAIRDAGAHLPAAPLRAYRSTSVRRVKRGFDAKDGNAYSNKRFRSRASIPRPT